MAAAGLAAGGAPAAATTGQADAALDANPACPEPREVARQTAARFTDVDADHVHAANIGCLVYYGITGGAGDGSYYDPDRAVNRWQMALFMTRAARRAGVTVPSVDQGFIDLDNFSSAISAGANAAAALGIMPGTSDTEFAPGAPVLRGDMALYLVRLLELITDEASPINVTVNGSTGEVTLTRRNGSAVVPDDTFDDVAGQIEAAQEHAINAVYELGVTTGKARGVYDPGSRVTRGEMAAFIIRLLGHSELRPDAAITLPPWEPPAPTARDVDADGVYATDPLHLIAYASFERAYSLPGADGDILEVWLCNTPDSGRRYSTHEDNRHNPSNYADKFTAQVTVWFEWLSDELYTPVFRPGGVVDVDRSADYFEACDEKVLNQNLRRWRDVHGVVVVVGVAADSEGLIGRASCGFFSQRNFPDNSRSILVSGDAFTDPTLLAHEMGHALCWPHSYSGETEDDHGEVYEYDNPMDIMGSPSYGEADPVPMIGTLAINRYASGWIPIDQVRIHKLGTIAQYELVPPGEDGVQLLVIPYEVRFEDESRLSYLTLGARAAGSGDMWWADADLPYEGVEIYDINQTAFGCELPDRGYCYGLDRRTIPVFDSDDGYDWEALTHVMVAASEGWWWGEAGEPDSFIVELASVNGSTFTVDVRPLVDEPKPAIPSDWDVDTGSVTVGDYTSASTFTNIGSEDAPNWLQLFVRCTGRDELDIHLGSSDSYFASTPTLQYRFGGQSSPTELSLTPSTDNRFGFLQEGDLNSFVRQLRADSSGLLYVDLWDVATYSGRSDHEGGGALGIAGVASHVEPILQECGY